MSGPETLRAAATRMRHDLDFGQFHGDPAFGAAVADYLDAQAERAEQGFSGSVYPQGLAIATAYLGSTA